MHSLKVREVSWKTHEATLSEIRLRVFVEEQNVPREIEMDDWDQHSIHVVAEHEGIPVGTGRLLPDGHIGRVAVLKPHRNQGVGQALMIKLLDIARRDGFSKVELSSQCHAKAFYLRFGFQTMGEVFQEAGIDHIAMVKSLD